MVVNYPSPDVPFTRIVEYKHVPNQPTAVKEGRVRCAASRCHVYAVPTDRS
jgi:UDP-galactopyranose mutase